MKTYIVLKDYAGGTRKVGEIDAPNRHEAFRALLLAIAKRQLPRRSYLK